MSKRDIKVFLKDILDEVTKLRNLQKMLIMKNF